jgi:acyl-CoA synthetase (NDP forming)
VSATTSTAATDIGRILNPESIAIVGASPNSHWGSQIVRNVATAGFPGPVAAINPKYTSIEGVDCYPRLSDLPFVPEAVELFISSRNVIPVLEEAAELGVRGAVVFATGFAEAGPEGRKLQQRLTDIARSADMALVGPNGLGTISFAHRCPLFFDRVDRYEPGRAALMSQSGQVSGMFINNHLGVRWSHVVSGGNEAVCGATDFVSYFVDDPHTDVIVGFLETIRDPEGFFYACDRARAAGKPVVVLKVGRTEAAQRAVIAHTGALSAPDRLLARLLDRHDVIRARSPHELLQLALALQQPPIAGPRIAVLSTSGGQIELLLDELVANDLEVAELSPSTIEALRARLPASLHATNPLDYWGVDDYQSAFAGLLRLLARDEGVDAVVCIADRNQDPVGEPGRERFMIEGARAVARDTGVPIALISPLGGGADPSVVEELGREGVLVLSGLPEAFAALAGSVRRARPAPAARVTRDLRTDPVNRTLQALGGNAGSGQPGLDVLRAAGIPTPRTIEVEDAAAAAAAARDIGFPVVLKLGDADALHKTEVGGVLIGLSDEDAVRAGAERLLAGGARRLLIQEQVSGGVELIAGITCDPQLGAFVLIGLGGIWTEVLDDVAIRPAGLREGEADEMLRELKTHALLEGARGEAPVDRAGVIAVIEQLDALALAHGRALDSIDVNPLIARPDGVVAVDALVVPAGAAGPAV